MNVLFFVAVPLLLSLGINLQAEPVSDKGGSIVYSLDDDFDMTRENVIIAIENQGLKVSGELHIQDMMQRTAKDLGIKKAVYDQAVAVEFCSAVFSHKMTQVHPANATMCPFTVVVYTQPENKDKVYLAFRKPYLLGDGAALEAEIIAFIRTIVEEVSE